MHLHDLSKYEVTSGTGFQLSDYSTAPEETISKKDSKKIIKSNVKSIADFQERMYANKNRSALVVLQAMDAAGKDGTIERLVTGINPQGVQVRNFKKPTPMELRHDFLWRVHLKLPPRGIIGIFNRSHYEEVLVVRVHPEFLIPQDIPGIHSPADVTDALWQRRFRMIRNFEQNLSETGTTVLKFFLHISKEEQKKRFLDRINQPDKHWKFNLEDVKQRPFWDDYMNAFDEAIRNTATHACPWYVVPGDDKPTARAIVTSIVSQKFSQRREDWPQTSPELQKEVAEGKALLESEDKSA